MPWQALLEMAAAVNAALLGAILLLSPRLHRTRARTRLAGFLLCVAWLLTSFTLLDQGWMPLSRGLEVFDLTLALLLAALFLDYIAGSLGRDRVPWWIYLPVPAFLLATMAAGNNGANAPGFGLVIAVQILYTAAATALFVANRKAIVTAPHHLLYLLGGMWLMHTAQVTRLLHPDVGWIFDAVPMVGTAFILGLTVLVLTDSRTLRLCTQVPGAAAPAGALDIEDLDRYMRTERPFLDPALNVESLARAAGVSARRLSALINQRTAGNFYDYVNGHRIAEAQRLLADPAEARTSAEALGLMVGFRARSTFYAAFRRITGRTPAEYRRGLRR